MSEFVREWTRAAVYWSAGAFCVLAGVGLIVGFSHALAWIGRSYGGIAAGVVVTLMIVAAIAIGSALQALSARQRNDAN